jgi:K+-transporting ATPase KdpF subunit
LAAGHVWAGTGIDGTVLSVPQGVREDLKGAVMLIYLTAGVAAFLFVYLWVAMIRPEKF